MLLQGLFVPLTCPFTREGRLFPQKLESNVRRYSLAPIAGMVALPPGGEASSLTDAEIAAFLHTVADAAAGEKVLVTGVQRGSVHAALELAQTAYEAGFDAVLLAPPFDCARLTRDEGAQALLLFFQYVADASPLPVILWSEAAQPSSSLPLEMVEELARHPNVIGLADADLTRERLTTLRAATAEVRHEVTVTTVFEAVTRRMRIVEENAPRTAGSGLVSVASLSSGSGAIVDQIPAPPSLKTRSKSVGFQLMAAGAANTMPALLEAGLAAAMPDLAAAAPQGCFEAYAAWKDGDPALSAERASRLKAADEVVARLGPAALKYSCDWNSYFGGLPRLPRLPLTGEERTLVERALGDVRN